jgi:hypothetical protein
MLGDIRDELGVQMAFIPLEQWVAKVGAESAHATVTTLEQLVSITTSILHPSVLIVAVGRLASDQVVGVLPWYGGWVEVSRDCRDAHRGGWSPTVRYTPPAREQFYYAKPASAWQGACRGLGEILEVGWLFRKIRLHHLVGNAIIEVSTDLARYMWYDIPSSCIPKLGTLNKCYTVQRVGKRILLHNERIQYT